MIATIRRYEGTPVQIDRLGLVPILGHQRGLVSYQAIDAGNNLAVSVSVDVDCAAADSGNHTGVACGTNTLGGLVGSAEAVVGKGRVSTVALTRD